MMRMVVVDMMVMSMGISTVTTTAMATATLMVTTMMNVVVGDDGGELHEVDDGERNSRDLLGQHPDPTTNDDVMCSLRNDLPYLG